MVHKVVVKERELKGLKYAGCGPAEIRAWVSAQLTGGLDAGNLEARCRFIVRVLSFEPGFNAPDTETEQALSFIRGRYAELRERMSFGEAATQAKTEWLIKYLTYSP